VKVERRFGPDPEAYVVHFSNPVHCQARAYLFREHRGASKVSIELYFDEDGIAWVESLDEDQTEHVFSALTDKLGLEGEPVTYLVGFGRPEHKMLTLSVHCDKGPTSH